MRLASFLLPLLVGLICGCGPDASAVGKNPAAAVATNTPPSNPGTKPAAEPATEAHYHLDHAQVGLPRVRLWIGANELESEVCTTLSQVSTGLMHRQGIGPSESMLFVFGTGARRSFYMKNVPFDIAAAYIDTEGTVREIVQLKRMNVDAVPSAAENIQFVLETAPDWFARNGVKPGTLIRTDSGSLREVLAPRAVLR